MKQQHAKTKQTIHIHIVCLMNSTTKFNWNPPFFSLCTVSFVNSTDYNMWEQVGDRANKKILSNLRKRRGEQEQKEQEKRGHLILFVRIYIVYLHCLSSMSMIYSSVWSNLHTTTKIELHECSRFCCSCCCWPSHHGHYNVKYTLEINK